ncbi:MAG: hypothetical protein O3A51_12995 [Verrucomicrobia bacterium]|nr:hypothetical protein [Verrucomicrobiota bacterium]
MTTQNDLEQQLDDFDAATRQQALTALLTEYGKTAMAVGDNVNMHMHSTFSFNAEEWSPSHIAWASRQAGLRAAALCDFDVLDGALEFLNAGEQLGLRSAAHVETRVFHDDCSDVVVTSPGEPGVTYIMGAGFTKIPDDGTPPAVELVAYRERARQRNLALVGRINAQVSDIAVDYDRDVVSLTPAGNATERHIVRAYINRAKTVFEHADHVARYWGQVLERDFEAMLELLADPPTLEEVVRARLAKRGGLGYEQPSETTFPPMQQFIDWVRACDAIPMITWLDGSSDGERDPATLLELQMARGCAALNIIPDRNWNLNNPGERATKTANLAAIVSEADRRGLPINIGTEMNKTGLPFVDDLAGAELAPYRETFVRGAEIMVGHSWLQRYAGYAYLGEQACSDYPDVHARNTFFASIGATAPLTRADVASLRAMAPDAALDWFRRRR